MDKSLIINAAFTVIIANGLEEFSIAKLANELNCTKSSIYNYFKSKDDLLNQIFVEKTRLLMKDINLEAEPDVIIRQYAHNCVENHQVFVFFHKYSDANFISKETLAEAKKELKLGIDVTKKLVASLNHEDVNPVVIEALILGPIHGLVLRQQWQNGFEITRKDVDDLVDFILMTIRKEKI